MKTITYNPETHVLVPLEPTRDMVIAGTHQRFRDSYDAEEDCYRAMIAAAPQPEPVESEPVAEHELQDTRCECCGYMTYHREHMGCIRSSTPQPDRVAGLEAALKVAKDALNIAADKFHDYAEIHAAKEASPENDIKVERNLMLSSDMDKALAKINEVLKP